MLSFNTLMVKCHLLVHMLLLSVIAVNSNDVVFG